MHCTAIHCTAPYYTALHQLGELEEALRQSAARLEEARGGGGGGCINGCPLDLSPEIQVAGGDWRGK